MTTSTPRAQIPQIGSTSPIFNANFLADGLFPDLELISSDAAHFYVHSAHLLANSANAFGGLLLQPCHSLALSEAAATVEIVLRVIYGISCTTPSPPPFEAAEAALDALVKYGVPVAQLAAPTYPLHELLRSYAPHYPIETYALVAHHELEDLARAVSAHLLAYDISRVTDELVIKMGPVYFSRLVKLQRSRMDALRDIILKPPAMHPVTPACSEELQRELSRAWAFASAEMVWNALPSISTYALESTFTQAASSIPCADCQLMLRNRIQEVVLQWTSVKVRPALDFVYCFRWRM
ncbi:hypothetical protein GY45DRAFT_333114 [Cubamyces sp. BRFM 1775]|nr:hypothetical protein GY45DRAFT_333114 [Cubamyces sp. BRFM 1775]